MKAFGQKPRAKEGPKAFPFLNFYPGLKCRVLLSLTVLRRFGSFVEANAAQETRIPREQLAEAAQIHQAVRQYLGEVEEQNPVEEPVHEPFAGADVGPGVIAMTSTTGVGPVRSDHSAPVLPSAALSFTSTNRPGDAPASWPKRPSSRRHNGRERKSRPCSRN